MQIYYDNNVKEKRLLVCMVGVLELLYEDIISIEEAESYLFSPRTIRILRERGCCEQILKVLEECCELENIESLLPDILLKTISELKYRTIQLMKRYPYLGNEDWLN